MKNKLTVIKNYIELKQKLLVNEINSFCIQIIEIINITPDIKPNMPNSKYDDIIEIKSKEVFWPKCKMAAANHLAWKAKLMIQN